MRLRDRAALLAVTWLAFTHPVIVRALDIHSSAGGVHIAVRRPVMIPRSVVVISNCLNYKNAYISMSNNIDRITVRKIAITDSGRNSLTSWRLQTPVFVFRSFNAAIEGWRRYMVLKTGVQRQAFRLWSDQQTYATAKFEGGRASVVLINHVPNYGLIGLNAWEFAIKPNVRSLIFDELMLYQPSLNGGEADIDEKKRCGYFCPEKYLIAVGCAVALSGLVLLFKILDKVYLDSRFNVNMAFCGFWLAAIIFWFGGWIVFHVLGLLS